MKPQLLILPLLCFVGYSAGALAQGAPPGPPPPVAPSVPPSAGSGAPPPVEPSAPPPAAADAVASSPPTVQPQEPAAASPPNIDLSTAPLTPAVQRTYHVHEGFYLRASVGFGYYSASFNDGNRPNLDFRNHGGDMALDLLIGGSPSPGVSIGGALLLNPQFDADYERDDDYRGSGGDRLGSHGGFSALMGPFIDGFPDVNNGWHLGGMIGFAGQSFQNVNGTPSGHTERALGIGGAAWFGYDFWVAGEWAIGPQMRVMGMRTKDTKSEEDISAFASSIDFGISALFN